MGRGISIHREDCINVLFDSKKESRLVKIDWEEEIYNVYPIEIEILVYDRAGILKDISTILANEKINVTDIYSTATKASYVVRIVLNLEVPGLEKLDNLLNKLLYLPNVIKAKRVTNSFS